MEIPVVLYLANIIDYLRAYLLYLAYQRFTQGEPINFAIFYLASYMLDAIDGVVARLINQTSKLGLYLDMIIDRVASSMGLILAAHQVLHDFSYPYGNLIAFGLYGVLVSVEWLSHIVVMFISEMGGFHQKEMKSDNRIVRAYLDKKPVLLWACGSFELTVLCLILSKPFWAIPWIPGFVFRSVANLLRLRDVIKLTASNKRSKD